MQKPEEKESGTKENNRNKDPIPGAFERMKLEEKKKTEEFYRRYEEKRFELLD